MRSARLIAVLLVVFCGCSQTFAKNVDLSTVPNRDTVQLTIYNSEDLTLVRETRKITFKKGANPLQFSWANTMIDPTSVELKFLTSAEKLEVLDTTFPRDTQKLYWNVQSDFDGEATVEITYFTSGITWAADYTVIADKEEKQMGVQGFVRITNNSGEDYEDAQVRLVVGTINLVEKIAELARVPMEKVRELQKDEFTRDRVLAGKAIFSRGGFGGGGGGRESEDKEKVIVKEGLSEYFIYSIEGTETVPNGWSKRMRSFEGSLVPFKVQYRYRPEEYGEALVRFYLLTNDTESKLGTTPLPNGIVRIFRDNGRDGLSYLVSQTIKYVPIGDKIELNLGTDPEVVFDLVKLKAWRDNIWMQFQNAKILRRVDDGAGKIELNSRVVGWDEHAAFTQRIRNYSTKAIDVEVRRPFSGDVVFHSNLGATLHDYRTVEFEGAVNAGEKEDFAFETVTHQGKNAKENHVTLDK